MPTRKKQRNINLRKTKKKLNIMTDVKPEIIKINGYTILLLPNKNNTITVKSYVNNGFLTETKETTGINHLLEHVLFSAWKKCNNKSCREFFHYRGIQSNASTNNTILTYHVEGLNDQTDTLLEYIITITTKPYIYKQLLEKEKHPVLNEILMLDNKRENSLLDAVNKNIYKLEGLKYRNDRIQQKKNLKNIDINKITHVFDKFYTPSNIIYTISGDYNKQNILNIFKELLPKNKQNKIHINRECFNKNREKIVFDKDKNAKTGTILYIFPVDLYEGDKNIFKIDIALKCLKYIIGKYLRYTKKFTYNFFIEIDTTICGSLIILKTNSQCKNIKEIYDTFDELLKKYINEGITNELLDSEKRRFLHKYINKYNDPHTIADFYSYQYINQIYNKSIKLYSKNEVKKIILDIKLIDIKNIFKRIFNLDHAVKAYQCSNKAL